MDRRKFLLTAFLGAFIFLNFFRPIEIEDTWWHLKTGEWIVGHGQVPHQDLFPFGGEKTPWTFTQWLGSSSLYLVSKFFGLTGLKVFRALFFTGILLLFFRYAVQRISLALAAGLTLLLIPPLYSRSFIRPDIFNYFFIQIFLICLLRFQQTGSAKALVPLPLTGILWSNINLGSFVYGVPLIGIFLLANLGSRHKAKAVLTVLGLYLASFFVSPYGYHNLIYPLEVFLKPDFIYFYYSLGVIEEMAPPLKYLHWDTGFWAMAFACFGVFALVKGRRDRLLHVLLFAFSLGLFLRGVRAGAFFALVTAYMVVESFKELPVSGAKTAPAQKLLWAVVIAALSAKGLLLAKNLSLQDIEQKNPRAALDFMKREGIKGQIFTDSIYGGYVLWSSYPRLRPFMDGRQVNGRRFLEYIHITQEPQKYWPPAQARYRFNTLLLDKHYNYSFAVMKLLDRREWKSVYSDDSSAVFVKI